MLKKLRAFIKNLKKDSTLSPEKPGLETNYRMFAVERAIIENALESIEVAARKNIVSPGEAKLLKDKYDLRLQELNQSIGKYVIASELRRLEEIKQQMRKEYESKISHLETQIKDVGKSSLQSGESRIKTAYRKTRGNLKVTQTERLKTLKDELLSAIERLEKMDQVGYPEQE